LISVFYFSNLKGKNNIGNEGAEIIGEVLMKNNSLTSLNLGILLLISNLIESSNIGYEGAKIIGEALIKNNSLTSLNLGILL